MILFVQFLLKTLVYALILLASSDIRRQFDRGKGCEEAEMLRCEQFEERSEHQNMLQSYKYINFIVLLLQNQFILLAKTIQPIYIYKTHISTKIIQNQLFYYSNALSFLQYLNLSIYSLIGRTKQDFFCLTLQGKMQFKLMSHYLYNRNPYFLQTKYFKRKYIMYEESPFLSASEEHKQLPPNLDQYWTLEPHQLPLVEEIEYEDKREEVKGHIQNENQPTKTSRKGRRTNDQNKDINRGHWSFEQNKKYHWFLQIHFKHFINRHMRRTDKIFKTMEIFIGTRQVEQCRSHHQKMEKKYLDFATIISNLRDIHYSTQDTQPLQDQLLANGIEIIDRLASMEQLKMYRKVENETEPHLSKKMSVMRSSKQNKKHNQNIEKIDNIKTELERLEEHKQDNVQMVKINMFEQLRNDLGELGMYHYQKEESGIFQSFFQSGH